MITLYELKTNGTCRCFMKTPFYVKNFILLCILNVMMMIIYFIYFRKDGMVFQNIGKILKGLNSNTFNYLEVNAEPLRLTKLLNNYQAQISSNQFYDDCMRINKPCKFEALAKTWPAFERWRFSEQKGYSYLKNKINDQQMEVYLGLDLDEDPTAAVSAGNSFNSQSLTKMRYSEFLNKMSTNSVPMTLKDSNQYVTKALKDEILSPSFIQEFSDIEQIEMVQGQVFVNPPHYERQEQFICSIDGYAQIKLIPHVYRQEVYAGKDKIKNDPDAQEGSIPQYEKMEPSYSPVNFFDPDLVQYPNFDEIERKYTVLLHEGDCVYIPAFYFYQYVAKPTSTEEFDGVKASALIVALKYKSNSALLSAFLDAVEKKILT